MADGAKVIQQQGDAGLDNTAKFFGNRLAHNSYIWTFAIEHSAEHYGQLVVYYRANNLVPPDPRRNQTQQPQPPPQPAPTIASTVDREISAIEKQIVEVAEAMPEEKFNFSPESLNIPGSNYKGVRAFAVQVKHVAASNYFIWSPITGDKLPEGLKDGNGPENLKTKADIIKFLKDSFALGHKAAATLTNENMLQLAERQQFDTSASGRIWRCPRLQSLWADGGVFADERNRSPCQPNAFRLNCEGIRAFEAEIVATIGSGEYMPR